MMSDLGYRMRASGVGVTGIVPYHPGTALGAPRCDMEVEELSSRFILQLAENRGSRQASGCRIDPAAVEEAAALIAASFRKCPELLIVNKFGRLEADGGGLSDVISNAVDHGIAVIVGVPERHLESWRGFTNGLAEEAALDSPRVQQWLIRRGFGARRELGRAEPALTSAA
jgi:nucleoside-triphosphatase THEP1